MSEDQDAQVVVEVEAAQPVADATPAIEVIEALAAEADGTAETIEVRGEKFRLASAIPAIVMLRLAAVTDGKASPAKQMAAIDTFLEKVVHDDDREEFLALLEDAEPVIDFEELNEIIETATEVIGARPTEQ